MQNSWHRLSLVRDKGTDLIVGGETAARPGIAGVPNDLDLTAGADDDQQSHRCQEIAARARRSGILRPRPGATLPPAPQSSQDFDVCCLAARDRSRTEPATPARPCRARPPCGRNYPPIAESEAHPTACRTSAIPMQRHHVACGTPSPPRRRRRARAGECTSAEPSVKTAKSADLSLLASIRRVATRPDAWFATLAVAPDPD
jgi:hypothetical protein